MIQACNLLDIKNPSSNKKIKTLKLDLGVAEARAK